MSVKYFGSNHILISSPTFLVLQWTENILDIPIVIVPVVQSFLEMSLCDISTRLIAVPALHYSDVIMGTIASQITSLTIVYSTIYSGADQRKHQSSASLAVVRGIYRGPVNSPHKWPVTRKMFPFDDVIMHWDLSTHICINKPGHRCIMSRLAPGHYLK